MSSQDNREQWIPPTKARDLRGYTLPTIDELRELGEPQEYAISIYAETSPAPDEREASFLHAKSAFDPAIRQLREGSGAYSEHAAAAYALTLSADGWKLWEATTTTTAAEMELLAITTPTPPKRTTAPPSAGAST